MTRIDHPDFRVWKTIDYRPTISEFLPKALAEHLYSGQRVLEVGCGTGSVSLWLGKRDLSVVGIDINSIAIAKAQQRAEGTFLDSPPSFRCASMCAEDWLPGEFDAVILIRLLTCLPHLSDWHDMLRAVHTVLAPKGLLYIHDFCFDAENRSYKDRYEYGRERGWRTGNFPVFLPAGELHFVAHHHTTNEIRTLRDTSAEILSRHHDSLSMNGNSCRMFELIGRKK